jgi:exopolysaccharide biosynthesis polyprenyl glycosylphosphotransferase
MRLNYLREHWRTVFIALAVATDFSMLIVSAVCSYFFRNVLPPLPEVSSSVYFYFTLYFISTLLLFCLVLGVYRATYHSNKQQQLFLAGKAYIYSMLVIFASFYIFHLHEIPRRFTFIFFLIVPLFFLFGRTLLNALNLYLQKKGYGIYKALLAGYENENAYMLYRFTGFPELGYDIQGVVTKHRGENTSNYLQIISEDETPNMQLPYYSLSELPQVVSKASIDKIFIPSPKFATNGYYELVEICKKENIELKVLSPESDQLLKMAHVYDIAGIPLFSNKTSAKKLISTILKRMFDIVASLVLILILSPLYIITAIVILIESGMPIIFKQKRASIKEGKSFDFIKFRSMVKGADNLKESLFQFNESTGMLFKMKNDPRMTRIGKIIRKFSIDELPQLFNVLRGEMSLVGPRPLPVSDLNNFKEEPEFWDAIRGRDNVKPGITGLWQISGRSNIGFKEMVLLDLYYVENQSFLFDLEILFETIPVVLFGKGSY